MTIEQFLADKTEQEMREIFDYQVKNIRTKWSYNGSLETLLYFLEGEWLGKFGYTGRTKDPEEVRHLVKCALSGKVPSKKFFESYLIGRNVLPGVFCHMKTTSEVASPFRDYDDINYSTEVTL